MTAPSDRTKGSATKEHAAQASNSVVVDRLGRMGYAALGTTYPLIGWIAAQLGFGQHPCAQANKRGTFEKRAQQPYGNVPLVGLVAYVVYLAVVAATGEPDEPDGKGGKKRLFFGLGSASRAGGSPGATGADRWAMMAR